MADRRGRGNGGRIPKKKYHNNQRNNGFYANEIFQGRTKNHSEVRDSTKNQADYSIKELIKGAIAYARKSAHL